MLDEYSLKYIWPALANVDLGSEADALRGIDIFLPIIEEQHVVSLKIQLMKYLFEEGYFRLCNAQ